MAGRFERHTAERAGGTTARDQLRRALDDAGIPPAVELRVLDEQDHATDSLLGQIDEIPSQIATVDAPGVASRGSVLSGEDRQAQPMRRKSRHLVTERRRLDSLPDQPIDAQAFLGH